MQPIARLTEDDARHLHGLLFDLDDTLLSDGRLTEAAYSALFRLKESGLRLVAVTGRPVTWGELLARLWPIDGVITENGPLAWTRTGTRVERWDTVTPLVREARRVELDALVERIRSAVPELVPADDVGGRLSDFTFDIGEHERPSEQSIARAVELGRAAGAAIFRSSVHLHFGFDRLDKASGAVRFLRRKWAADATSARRDYAFIGDSENDAACFAAFRTTIGVANLRGSLSLRPRFSTHGRMGDGFIEAAATIVARRQAIAPRDGQPPHGGLRVDGPLDE